MQERRSIIILFLTWALTPAAVESATGDYTGAAVCGECHEDQADLWTGSHHDLAMAEATPGTVLGDFDDATFTAHGVTSRFFRRDGDYYVRSDGPDGELGDFRIPYTFGWYPLQQYLVELPRGRLQSLGLAWDSRPRAAGGQRWFHLYPNEPGMDHDHPLHWTARDQTWNYQCAECHSTDLKKNYDPASDGYATTWAEIDVACEACHGPGANHVAQARAAADKGPTAWDAGKGLVVDLTVRDGGTWSIDPGTGSPARSRLRRDWTELETCARCHARRGQVHDQYAHARPLADTHRLALLDEGLYHADGQIKDEVYVYGSFIQSRMQRMGVTCSDCHDPHSLRLKAEGNLVCASCHPAGRYDTTAHHHHAVGTPGAACVACHMPQSTYMVVDPRADHSLRVPRPDLTLAIGTPNACNDCHADKSPDWAAAAIAEWAAPERYLAPHFGEAIQAARSGAADAGERLLALAADSVQPPIVRATALELLGEAPGPSALAILPRMLADPDPLLRAAAARYLGRTDPELRVRLALPLLDDPVRLVRLDAASSLAPLLRYALPETLRGRIEPAVADYRQALLVTAERPESHLSIGLLDTSLGDAEAAAAAYRKAIALDPTFVPAYVNLADLYRQTGRDAAGEEVLLKGIARAPDEPGPYQALGLLYVRTNRLREAVDALARAAALAPDRPGFAYLHALALKETGDVGGALRVLATAHEHHPEHRDLLLALATINRDAGNRDAALTYARKLLERAPGDARAADLVRQLDAGG